MHRFVSSTSDCRPVLVSALRLILLAACCAACVACKTQSLTRESTLVMFQGFVFVGATKSETGPLEPHGTDELSLPPELETGVRYVFHHSRADNSELALVHLPKGIEAAGYRLIRGPRSTKDLADPFVGGPLFSIEIAHRNHSGKIYNQIDPDFLKT